MSKPNQSLEQVRLFGVNGVIASENVTAPSGNTSTLTITNTQEDSSKQMTIMTATNESTSSGTASLEISTGNAVAGGNSGNIVIKTGTSSGTRGEVIIQNVAEPVNDADVATKAYVDSQSGGSGANTELSNLGTTAINADLLFDTDAEYDIGAVDARPNKIFGISLSDFEDEEVLNIDDRALKLDNSTVQLDFSSPGELSVENNKITNLGTPTNGTDAATKDYVDSQAGGGDLFISIPLGAFKLTSGASGVTINNNSILFSNGSSGGVTATVTLPPSYVTGTQIKVRAVVESYQAPTCSIPVTTLAILLGEGTSASGAEGSLSIPTASAGFNLQAANITDASGLIGGLGPIDANSTIAITLANATNAVDEVYVYGVYIYTE